MSDIFDQFRATIVEARRLDNAVASNANSMAELLAGKLQSSNIGYSTLKKLKNELRRFNPHTGRWREAK